MTDFEEACDCGGTYRFTVNDVAKERAVQCSHGCGKTIRLEDGGGAAEAVAAERALGKALKGLGGTTNIKF